MSKEKNIIHTLKTMLGMETNLVETTLKNGNPVKYDKLEAGGIFQVKDGESFLTAPVGEYELEDGNIVIVTEVGIIAEVKAPVMQVEIVPSDPEIPEETPEVAGETEEDAMKTKLEELDARIKMLEEAIATLTGDATEMKSQFSVQEEKLKELANAPASIPVHLAKTETRPLTVAEQRMEQFKNLKK